MFKQFFINKYFQKLSNTKFFRNDENAIIGKAKDVIKNLQNQIHYVENPHNDIDEENRDFIVEEANSLIEEIQKEYRNKNNVIGLYNHPMAGFYVLQDKYTLYKDLKDYYNELEEKNK
jgi:hypothetical protein